LNILERREGVANICFANEYDLYEEIIKIFQVFKLI
tara:strand:- start:59 stop:166 length:108 start_codon:yes stop_codon:yes gene_type:complete